MRCNRKIRESLPFISTPPLRNKKIDYAKIFNVSGNAAAFLGISAGIFKSFNRSLVPTCSPIEASYLFAICSFGLFFIAESARAHHVFYCGKKRKFS
jgi:hypothetical protein